jgi:acetylornithine/succinyldiaminopimelate/putrescine aminotransferase
MEHGLLLMTTGWRETIRFIPALVVSQPEMDDVLARFGKGLEDAIKAWKGPKPTPHRLWTVSRAN